MRRCILVSLFVGAAACGLGKGTGPESTLIGVRVRDDRGASAGRNPVIVVLSDSTRTTSQTRSDGTAEIRVAEAGSYLVSIIPRAGYFAGTDPLSKRITVMANARTEVEFTLYRQGVSTSDPPGEPSGTRSPPP